MIKKEWEFIWKHKFLLVVLGAVALIPALYNLIFLGALWDPYGSVENLPVAVVNKDQAVAFQEQTLEIGNELITNLKENESLDYHFVSAEEAETGLSNGDYYLIITIPENFSENATTLLTDNPQKMVIDYQTSEGHNLIASKMADSAVTELKNQVSAEVTEMYSETLLKQFDKIGLGMTEAAEGSQKLEDGTAKLTDASQMIQENLDTLAARSLEFSEGSQTLQAGLQEYVTGVDQVNDGANQLTSGIRSLSSQLPTLSLGMGDLSSGARSLTSGIQQYTNGVDTINSGTSQLNDGLSQVVEQTKSFPDQTKELNDGAQKLAESLQAVTMSAEDKEQLMNYVVGVQSYVQQVSQILTDLDLSSLNNSDQITAFFPAISNDLALMQESIFQLNANLDADKDTLKVSYQEDLATNASAVIQALTESGLSLTDEQKSLVLSTMQNQMSNTEAAADRLSIDTSGIMSALSSSQVDLQNLANALSALENIPMDKVSELKSGADQLSTSSSAATTALTAAVNGLYNIQMQAAPAAQAIADGTSQLNNRIPALVASLQQLQAGSQSLEDGTSQLMQNSPTLTEGATSLSEGLLTVNDGIPALNEGVNALLTGSKSLSAGIEELTENSDHLVSGTSQLTLGASQIAHGSTQLADGEKQVTHSLREVKTGLSQLSERFSASSEQIQQINTDKKSAKAVSEPIETMHEDKARVANNGTSMAPYMMSVALFIGSLTVNMMYDAFDPKKKPSSAIGWWASKMSVLGIVAILQAALVFLVLTNILGMTTLHPLRVFGFLILESLTFMSIVTLFNLLLEKVGSFVMLLFMILQLAGSGGTYPIVLSNNFFQSIYRFLPMTYAIDALRQSISIGGTIRADVFLFVALLLISNICMILFFTHKKKQHLETI